MFSLLVSSQAAVADPYGDTFATDPQSSTPRPIEVSMASEGLYHNLGVAIEVAIDGAARIQNDPSINQNLALLDQVSYAKPASNLYRLAVSQIVDASQTYQQAQASQSQGVYQEALFQAWAVTRSKPINLVPIPPFRQAPKKVFNQADRLYSISR
jgi:hypothetical protein